MIYIPVILYNILDNKYHTDIHVKRKNQNVYDENYRLYY